ncbi:hypothetical protein B7463_g12105, partial [Scytalidium lignicola]
MPRWHSRLFRHPAGAHNAASASSSPTTSTASLPRKAFPCGIKLLHSAENSVVDIIFIHGLTGDREKTWTAKGATAPWPQSLLPAKIPNARVLTFGYDAYVADWRGMVSMNRIGDHSMNLLTAVATCREEDDTNNRPIIFVCHSLGGLVCEDALVKARQRREKHLKSILACTRGIIFLGTPHHGSGLAKWAELVARSIGLVKQTNTQILEVLQGESEVLARIQDSFHTMIKAGREDGLRPIEITCFFEELPLPGVGVVVPSHSAILPGYVPIGIHSTHIGMTKFERGDDPGFTAVAGELRRWVKETITYSKTVVPDAVAAQKLQLVGGSSDFIHSQVKKSQYKKQSWFWKSPEYEVWRSNEGSQFLWCTGKPATGKSSIATTLVSDLSKERIYSESVAHFFFQTPVEGNASPFIPGLVVCSIMAQLLHTRYNLTAIHDHAVWFGHNEYEILLKAFICTVNINRIYEEEQIRYSGEGSNGGYVSPELSRATSALRSLSEDDLWKILTSFVHASAGHSIYIVIDGVESMLTEDQSRLLRNLRDLWSSVQAKSSPSLKILITSRPQVKMQVLLNGLAYIDQDKEYKDETVESLLEAECRSVIGSFFYSARDGERETSHQHMLQTLLHEILAHKPELYPHFQGAYRRLRAASEDHITWSYTDLKEVFIGIMNACEKSLQIFFLIDALDESDQTELRDVLLLLKEGSKASTCVVKILLASRPNETISRALTGTFHVILEHENKQDIASLVDTKLAFLREPDDTSLFEWTSKYLNEHAQGVFLWVSLITQELDHWAEGGYSEAEIKDMLAEHQPNVVTEAKEMLGWTCYTERPLTAIELRDIIAISSRPDRTSIMSVNTFETSKLRRLGDLRKRIRRNCGDLLEIKKQGSLPQPQCNFQSVDVDPQDVVQLLHQTAREFLIRPDKIAQPFDIDDRSANNTIGLVCAHYIKVSLATDHDPVNGTTLPRCTEYWTIDHYTQLLERLEIRPLLHYALKYLPYHLSCIPRSDSQAWSLINDYFHHVKRRDGFVWYLLQEWFERLEFPKTPASSSESSMQFRIASLVAGIKYKRLGAVRALSEVQRDLDYIDHHTNHTALQMAASCGDTSTIEFLINNGASVNFHGGYFGTALQAAAYHGHSEVVTILLDRGADPNSEAGFWGTAFLGAACAGHENIAKNLFDHGSDTYSTPELFERLSADPGQLDIVGRSSISVFSAIIGSDHPDTLSIMANLALTYSNQGRWKEAEELQVQVIEMTKKMLGEEHPNTLASIANLAFTYSNQGRQKEAEDLEEQVMEMRKRVLGEGHPDTLISMANLAFTWKSQSRNYEALKLMKECLELRQQRLGENHPDTVSSRDTLKEWEQNGISV